LAGCKLEFEDCQAILFSKNAASVPTLFEPFSGCNLLGYSLLPLIFIT
jgi:hypothetical protein